MLPTFGLFSSANCPYFMAGLCSRTHCLFKHPKNINTTNKMNIIKLKTDDLRREEQKDKKSANSHDDAENFSSNNKVNVNKCKENKDNDDKSKSPKKEKSRRDSGSKEINDKSHKSKSLEKEKSRRDSNSKKVNDKDKSPKKEKPRRDSSSKKINYKDKSQEKEKSRRDSNSSKDESKLSTSNNSSSHHSSSSLKSSSASSSSKSHTSSKKTSNSHSSHSSSSRTTSHSSSSSSTHKHKSHKHSKSRDKISDKVKDSSSRKRSSTSSTSSHDTSLKKTKDEAEKDTNNILQVEKKEDFLGPDNNLSSDEDPDEIEKECLEMFNNYNSTNLDVKEYSPKKIPVLGYEPGDIVIEPPLGKRRLAHVGADQKRSFSSVPAPKPKISSNPAEIMLKRYQSQPQQESSSTFAQQPQTVPVPVIGRQTEGYRPNTKKRIAHVNNVAGLLIKPYAADQNCKAYNTLVKNNEVQPASNNNNKTLSQTNPKGQSRVAHAANLQNNSGNNSNLRPPIITYNNNTKIPTVCRQKVLDQFVFEFIKFLPAEISYKRAIEEESLISAKCSSKPVYFSLATNYITRIRRETLLDSSNLLGSNSTISHEKVLAGSLGAKCSWSIEKKSNSDSTTNDVYKRISKYLLTEEQLVDNGYPRSVTGESGKAVAKPRYYSSNNNNLSASSYNPLIKICDRCNKDFRVDKQGFPVKGVKCLYHYGRRFKTKTNGLLESKISCCNGDVNTEGCAVAASHVNKGESGATLVGFVSAVQSAGPEDTMGSNPWDIIGLDCEMVYTTHGIELARVTVVGVDSSIIYDELVLTTHPVIDYNTRFSGITEELMKSARVNLIGVQAALLTKLKPNTIIIGHSLESDLLSLKLIHSSVVDTSLIFPHKMGLPFKRALRNITAEVLKKIIQDGEGGHNSAEDAQSAVELVLYKIKKS